MFSPPCEKHRSSSEWSRRVIRGEADSGEPLESSPLANHRVRVGGSGNDPSRSGNNSRSPGDDNREHRPELAPLAPPLASSPPRNAAYTQRMSQTNTELCECWLNSVLVGEIAYPCKRLRFAAVPIGNHIPPLSLLVQEHARWLLALRDCFCFFHTHLSLCCQRLSDAHSDQPGSSKQVLLLSLNQLRLFLLLDKKGRLPSKNVEYGRVHQSRMHVL